jgi:TolB-like protein/Tfp pilus assembly protein PilF
MNGSKRPLQENQSTPGERLETWKEIAAYLRRGVRTVRRWEKQEGLPIHRHLHKKLGTVYAHRSELDAWWSGPRASVTEPYEAGGHRRRKGSTRLMIAVLPFSNVGGDPQQDYFSDGLTEEMISQLGRFQPQALAVIARTTVMQYKGKNKTIREIGEELAVDYILEGSVRCEADRVRVTAQLIDVRDQTQLWANGYEQPMRAILALQRQLAIDIGREIRLKLSPQRQTPLDDMGAVSPDAYHAHLKGRHLLNSFTPESVRRSLEQFRYAIEADPGYARSYASLAEAYERFPMWVGAPSRQTFPLALQAAEKALELDPSLPEAYASLGLIHANYLWDWARAERHFQRALELNPDCSPAGQWYAEFLAEMGRTDEALLIIDRALLSDPLSSVVQTTRAFALWFGRRFDEAIAQAQQVLEADPQYPMALIRLGVAYAAKEMHEEAVRAFRAAGKAAPGLLDCIGLLGYAQGRAGNRRSALKQLDELRSAASARYVPPFVFAMVHLGLGEHDEALRFIEKEYDARGWYLLLIKHAPQFDPLRRHPRFRALIRRLNFPMEA